MVMVLMIMMVMVMMRVGGGTDKAFKPGQRRTKYCLRLNSIAVEVRM